MSDLIERLRLWGNGEHRPAPLWGDVNWPHLLNEAADRIEELEAQVERYEEILQNAVKIREELEKERNMYKEEARRLQRREQGRSPTTGPRRA